MYKLRNLIYKMYDNVTHFDDDIDVPLSDIIPYSGRMIKIGN